MSIIFSRLAKGSIAGLAVGLQSLFGVFRPRHHSSEYPYFLKLIRIKDLVKSPAQSFAIPGCCVGGNGLLIIPIEERKA
jgi:hypothetical protein